MVPRPSGRGHRCYAQKWSSMRVSRIGCLASIVISVASSLILTVILRPDHLVAATTHDCFGSTRPDWQSNIDNNRCRGTVLHPEGIIARSDMRNPDIYEAAFTLTPTTPTLKATANRAANNPEDPQFVTRVCGVAVSASASTMASRVTVGARGRSGLGRRSPGHVVGFRRRGWWTPRRRRRRAGSCPSRR
jgi:hypothetical protein